MVGGTARDERKLHYLVGISSTSQATGESCWLHVTDMISEGQGAMSSSPR